MLNSKYSICACAWDSEYYFIPFSKFYLSTKKNFLRDFFIYGSACQPKIFAFKQLLVSCLEFQQETTLTTKLWQGNKFPLYYQALLTLLIVLTGMILLKMLT